MIILLCGTGTSHQEQLIRQLKEQKNIAYIPLITNRPINTSLGEIDGENYYFVPTTAVFNKLVDNGNILNHYKENGYWYGISKIDINEAQEEKKVIVISTTIDSVEIIHQQLGKNSKQKQTIISANLIDDNTICSVTHNEMLGIEEEEMNQPQYQVAFTYEFHLDNRFNSEECCNRLLSHFRKEVFS